MDNYFTFTQLLGIRDQNLPLSREKRLDRLKGFSSVVKLYYILYTSYFRAPADTNATFLKDPVFFPLPNTPPP